MLKQMSCRHALQTIVQNKIEVDPSSIHSQWSLMDEPIRHVKVISDLLPIASILTSKAKMGAFQGKLIWRKVSGKTLWFSSANDTDY